MVRFLQSFLILLFITVYSQVSFSQDVLYLRDNTTINAKVKEIAEEAVIYIQAGQDYSIERKEVVLIIYEDGTHTVVKNKSQVVLLEVNEDFGRHLVSWQVGDLWQFNISGAYEYFFTSGIMSLRIPVSADIDAYSKRAIGKNEVRRIMYTGLDCNFYPFRQRAISPYVGPGVRYSKLRNFIGYEYIKTANYPKWLRSTEIGLYANGGLLFQLSPQLGVNLGLGFGVNSTWYEDGTEEYYFDVLRHFSIGYRF